MDAFPHEKKNFTSNSPLEKTRPYLLPADFCLRETKKVFFPCEAKKTNWRLENAKKHPLEKIYPGNLKKTGKVLVGLCPFHEEKTPSFTIYPQTNTFFCFGCRENGDAIKLYMKIKGCSFSEALEALSQNV